MISIFEKPTRNSGIIGGKFLEKTRIPKPGSTVENPEFYSPADFALGATIEGKDLSSSANLYLYICSWAWASQKSTWSYSLCSKKKIQPYFSY